MEHKITENLILASAVAIKKGLSFPLVSTASILNGKDIKNIVRQDEIRTKILVMLETKKDVDIELLVNKFGFTLPEISDAINYLESKNLIKRRN